MLRIAPEKGSKTLPPSASSDFTSALNFTTYELGEARWGGSPRNTWPLVTQSAHPEPLSDGPPCPRGRKVSFKVITCSQAHTWGDW